MTQAGPPSHRAGGFLIAASILIGTGIGVALGQPTIGILVGTAFGVTLAFGLWLRDRRRG